MTSIAILGGIGHEGFGLGLCWAKAGHNIIIGSRSAEKAQNLLGPGVKVVTAFQNISAEHLKDPDHPIDCDVLVCGDDKDAKAVVIQLAADAGMRAWDAGPLANAVVAEGLTSVLISLNLKYKVKSSGIRITGINS